MTMNVSTVKKNKNIEQRMTFQRIIGKWGGGSREKNANQPIFNGSIEWSANLYEYISSQHGRSHGRQFVVVIIVVQRFTASSFLYDVQRYFLCLITVCFFFVVLCVHAHTDTHTHTPSAGRHSILNRLCSILFLLFLCVYWVFILSVVIHVWKKKLIGTIGEKERKQCVRNFLLHQFTFFICKELNYSTVCINFTVIQR